MEPRNGNEPQPEPYVPFSQLFNKTRFDNQRRDNNRADNDHHAANGDRRLPGDRGRNGDQGQPGNRKGKSNEQNSNPRSFQSIPRQGPHIPDPNKIGMEGSFRPVYDFAHFPPSTLHDTTRSRLNDARFVQPNGRPNIRPRAVAFGKLSSSSYDSHDSRGRPRRHGNRQSSRKGRSHGSRNGSKAQIVVKQQQPEPPKSMLETIFTPLRVGILLGCFDIVGGSLSAWMTIKRFGKAAQQATDIQGQQDQQGNGGDRSPDSGRHARRSRGERRRGDRRSYPHYDSESSSDSDSNYEERLRRTAEHVREQRKLGDEMRRASARPLRDNLPDQHPKRR